MVIVAKPYARRQNRVMQREQFPCAAKSQVRQWTFAHHVLKLNAILTFWLAYIFTRPLGHLVG